MKKKKPIRVKLLLWSCWINCIITFIFLVALGIQLFEGFGSRLTTALTSLFFLVFFFYGAIFIYLIRRFYPSYEVPTTTLISYRIITGLVILIMAFVLLGIIGILVTEINITGFAEDLRDPIILSTFISLTTVFLTQIHMIIEGNWVIKSIGNNFRNSLLNNW